eukprot:TRINITY_DN277_c0_g1_i1.p1 TRINITY_DN277_c0_g1~~TRINITY_DN277_c0_g1_i1.p1  ORF type:complete len:198 (-),score=56.27 TRINITY_DN277_c0_g1_i1:113-706(-)
MSEALFGICGKDFVIMAADQHAAFSICRLKDDVDKIYEVEGKMFAASGPNADTTNFVEFISKNLRLQALRTGLKASVKAVTNFTRNELAYSLRKGPYQADLLIGGVDEDGTPSLYFMDYLASSEKVQKAAHGYGAYFALSIMDRYYKPDLTVEEAKDIIVKCVVEMQTRFLIHMGKFKCKIATKDGVQEVTLDIPAK